MNSYHDDPDGVEENMDIEEDDKYSESSYGDADLLEEIDELEDDEVTFVRAKNTLPRPPTKPNVHIDDEATCPVCTQRGKFKRHCE